MKIDFNATECQAMEAFIRRDTQQGSELQGRFIEELKQSMRNGEDYCPCPANCSIHKNCVLCVQIHRGHGHHLPYCMQKMLNRKLASLSELTEHSIVNEIQTPEYLK